MRSLNRRGSCRPRGRAKNTHSPLNDWAKAMCWPGAESSHRHADFQSRVGSLKALYFKELPGRPLPNMQYSAGLCTTSSRKTHAEKATLRDLYAHRQHRLRVERFDHDCLQPGSTDFRARRLHNRPKSSIFRRGLIPLGLVAHRDCPLTVTSWPAVMSGKCRGSGSRYPGP